MREKTSFLQFTVADRGDVVMGKAGFEYGFE